MSDVKTFVITKEAAAAAGVGGTRRKRKATKKDLLPEEDFLVEKHKKNSPLIIQKHGGDHGAVPVPSSMEAVPMPSSVRAVPMPAVPMPPTPIPSSAAATSAVPMALRAPSHEQEGGKPVKVELKKKTEIKSVHLRPKSDAMVPKKTQTKRRSKLVLGLSSLRKRITRAKHIHRRVKQMPLDTLKEELIKKRLIRPTSKAPESVLRQIARDSQMVATSM